MKLVGLRSSATRVRVDVSLANTKRSADTMMQLRDRAAVGGSLRDMLLDAQHQGRLTCGIYDSGTLLAKNPDGVMLCILPEDTSSDVTLHIHFTLIEAFCWENDIRIVKVDSVKKLEKLLKENSEEFEIDYAAWPASDYNCLLIEYPRECCSPAEERVLEFHKQSSDLFPLPIVQLDV